MGVFVSVLVGLAVGIAGFLGGYFLARMRFARGLKGRDALVEFSLTSGLPLLVVDSFRQAIAVSPEVEALGVEPGGSAATSIASIASDAFRTGKKVEVKSDLGLESIQPGAPFLVRAVAVGNELVVIVIEDRRESNRLDSVRSDFLVNVSHEIKTPVAAIALLAEALSAAAEDPAAVRNFTRSLSTEVERLARMTRDVIELSRIEAGIVDVSRDPFPIGEAIREAVAENASVTSTKRIAVLTDIDDEVVVWADRRMITAALSNLVENALQYSRGGTTVRISAKTVGNMVVILVSDEGRGIRPENRDRVFERFYREDSSRSREGSGLGLSIVKHTAAVHHGSVSVSSRLGIGSTFRFEIPVAGVPHQE